MPHLTQTFHPIQGPIIDIIVGVSIPRREALAKAGDPVPGQLHLRALVDTGASATSIDVEVAKDLALPVTSVCDLITPSTGATPVKIQCHDVSLVLFSPPGHSLTINALSVSASVLRHQGFDVLLGRDVLSRCLLVYDGNGVFSLSF